MGFKLFGKQKLLANDYDAYFKKLMGDCSNYLLFEKQLYNKLRNQSDNNTLSILLFCNPKMFFIDEEYRNSILTKISETHSATLITRIKSFTRFLYTKYPEKFIEILKDHMLKSLIKDIFKNKQTFAYNNKIIKKHMVEQLFDQHDLWVIMILQYSNMFTNNYRFFLS